MRAIDADALIKTIDSHCYPVQHDMTSIEPGMTRIGILQAIQEQPTIEERKTGKWIPQDNNKTNGMASTLVYYYPKCSVCGHCDNYTNFCPNCGADMRCEDDNIPMEYFESGGK